jgi:hypothetical protein
VNALGTLIGAVLVGIFAVLVLGGLLALFMALPVWLLWNWVCVDALHLPALTFWQSFGLALLCSILFKNHNTKSVKD